MKKNQPKLSVINLSVHYHDTRNRVVKAVNGVNFEIKENESMGIAGESASGKSTLGSALMRNLESTAEITSGSVLLDDLDIIKLDDMEFSKEVRWKKISMIFQGAMNTLDPVFTIGNQMREILMSHGVESDLEDRIFVSLDEVGLDRTTASMYPHELSGGMKQRVVIAMSLLLNPDILIADEPTTALDVLVQAQIIKLLKSVKKKKGVTVIIISHDIGVISKLADKVGIMYSGEIVELASIEEILESPKHPYTQILISSIPKLNSGVPADTLKGEPPDLSSLPDGCNFMARCPYAMEKCRDKPPALKTATGFVLCWLHE